MEGLLEVQSVGEAQVGSGKAGGGVTEPTSVSFGYATRVTGQCEGLGGNCIHPQTRS